MHNPPPFVPDDLRASPSGPYVPPAVVPPVTPSVIRWGVDQTVKTMLIAATVGTLASWPRDADDNLRIHFPTIKPGNGVRVQYTVTLQNVDAEDQADFTWVAGVSFDSFATTFAILNTQSAALLGPSGEFSAIGTGAAQGIFIVPDGATQADFVILYSADNPAQCAGTDLGSGISGCRLEATELDASILVPTVFDVTGYCSLVAI